jgi:hypothetical protein
VRLIGPLAVDDSAQRLLLPGDVSGQDSGRIGWFRAMQVGLVARQPLQQVLGPLGLWAVVLDFVLQRLIHRGVEQPGRVGIPPAPITPAGSRRGDGSMAEERSVHVEGKRFAQGEAFERIICLCPRCYGSVGADLHLDRCLCFVDAVAIR